MTERDLSYQIIQKTRGQSPVLIGHIQATCAVCNHVEEVPWRGHHNPHHISNHFKRLGWEFDAYKRAKIKCPQCKSTRSPSNVAERLPEFNTFGERFRYLREQAHLKRDSVALEAGIDLTLLGHIESGRESAFKLDESSINKLINVLRGHGVPVNRTWLLDWQSQGATLAANVRRAMEKYHFTEGSLADKSRVPLSQIKLILSGVIPTHHRLPELAVVLQTTAQKLIGAPEATRERPRSLPAAVPQKAPATPSSLVGNTIAERLREARRAKDMSQAKLAEAIKNEGSELALSTLIWALSRIERNVSVGGQTTLLMYAADILGVRPDWLLARAEHALPAGEATPPPPEPVEVIPAPVTKPSPPPPPPRDPPVLVAPPSVQAPPVVQSSATKLSQAIDAELFEVLRGKLERAEGEIADLKAMLADASALLVETRTELERAVGVLKSSTAPPAIINGNGSYDAPRPVSRPVLNGNGAAHGNMNRNGTDTGIVIANNTVSESYIDRYCDSKQNTFARELLRVGARDLTIDIIESRMGYILRRLIPPRTDTEAKRRAYIHALMRREAVAENGVLQKTGPGSWMLREGATI